VTTIYKYRYIRRFPVTGTNLGKKRTRRKHLQTEEKLDDISARKYAFTVNEHIYINSIKQTKAAAFTFTKDKCDLEAQGPDCIWSAGIDMGSRLEK
jgi:hypothetical protein